MNEILQNKISELDSAKDYECWYLVKQDTSFVSLCYQVEFLRKFQEDSKGLNLETFVKQSVAQLKLEKPSVIVSETHRALRVAAFFGLIKMMSRSYNDAIVSPTFYEITNLCGGEFEKKEHYIDVMKRQIEKIFISSNIDEEYEGIRREFRLYPVMLLYKVLIELGHSTGEYSITINEYRYLVATTKNFEDFLSTLLLIKLVRENPQVNSTFEQYRTKFDNRLIQALKQLPTLEITSDKIFIPEDRIDEVSYKVYSFEKNPDVFTNDNYLNFLASTKSLFDLEENHAYDCHNKEFFECSFPRNRIIFGAPGTGKSYTFNKESIGNNVNTDEDFLLKNGGEYERVTFHPDYSYAQFVGTYKPTTSKAESLSISDENKKILQILIDANKSSQEKYDLLFKTFKDGDLTRLPVLLGLYTDEPFKTRKKDGTDASGDNSVERNHGRAIRPYVNLNPTEQLHDLITYEYVPGPFMRTLVKALKNKKSGNIKPYLLLIEEINRANVAAVFGDVFQLLDRDDTNQSEYPIQASEDMKKYLVKELGGSISDYDQIRIPDNMFIWATMNSADQGVFSMDTAFKRRWDFTYQGINAGEENIEAYSHKMGGSQVPVNWNMLRKAINAELITYNINEDKLMGAHFIGKESLMDKEIFDKTFKTKVIMYLFDDAAKQKRTSLFSGVESPRSSKLYSDICEAYDEIGISIFSENIKVKFDNQIDLTIDFEGI